MNKFFLEHRNARTNSPFATVATSVRSNLIAANARPKRTAMSADKTPISPSSPLPASTDLPRNPQWESYWQLSKKALRAFLAIGRCIGTGPASQGRIDVFLTNQARHDLDELQSRLGCATSAIAIEMILSAVANNAPLPLAEYRPSNIAPVHGAPGACHYAR